MGGRVYPFIPFWVVAVMIGLLVSTSSVMAQALPVPNLKIGIGEAKDPGEVSVGAALRFVFRIKDVDRVRGFHRYFWKATLRRS